MPRDLMLAGSLLSLALLLVPAAKTASAQPPEAPSPGNQDGQTAAVSVGIGGVYRVGYWTGVRYQQPTGDTAAGETASVRQVETLDGDGVRVRYQQAAPAAPAASLRERATWSYIVPGATAAPLRLVGAEDNVLWQGRVSGNAIDPATPWVVALGDSYGLETLGRSELLGRDALVAVVGAGAADELPDQAAGWDGVDLLSINPAAAALLRELNPAQVAAITQWVNGGGRLFVTLGSQGGELFAAAPWLAELTGVAVGEELLRLDPAALETYTSSQTPLPTLLGYPLPAQGPRVLIAGRTATRQPANLVIERLAGLGRVTVTAFALDSPEMAAWPQRTALIARLHPGLLDVDTQRRRETRTTAAVAYDDLAGQVHAALDRFASQRRTPFSIISLIVLLVAALIGPLDYWLINRVLGRPLLGWVSFPLSIVLMSAVVLGMQYRARPAAAAAAGAATVASEHTELAEHTAPAEHTAQPATIRANRIEIVDINAVSQPAVGRGLSLTHISSATAARIDFAPNISPVLAAGGSRGGLPALTGPYGYPSTTFGGIAIAGEDRSLPAYAIDLQHAAAEPGAASRLFGGVAGAPLAAASSKAWMTRWAFDPAVGETSGLMRRRGSELITGSVANPLEVDLLSGVLVYGNWAYLLPTRFRAGSRIAAIDTLRQKNFRWHLSRREALESSSRMDTWNVQLHDDFERLTEVLMFESAIGGREYTGLANRPLGGLDLSHVLAHGHAILYGWLPQPMLQTDLPDERPAVSAVRIILPVAPATPRES